MSCDPAYVRHAGENVLWLHVEDEFVCERGVEQVSSHSVHNSFKSVLYFHHNIIYRVVQNKPLTPDSSNELCY